MQHPAFMMADVNDSKERWLTPEEAAEFLHMHRTSVARLADNGELACERTHGGHRRYRLADVEALRAKAQEPKAS